jgi:hypothetical protein
MKWIEASHLELWGRTTQSEADLPALLADLVCATTSSIQSIRFPSRGKGRTRGFDGVIECLEEILFVPLGKSIWELKTSVNYKDMALDDFKKRTRETDAEEQKGLTLVLVTPFTWDSSKTTMTLDSWVADRKAESSWKEVVLIDGPKLEHWFDHAPAVAAHWARGAIRNFPIAGVQSTDEYWRDFSGRFDPRIIEKLLTAEREDVAEQLLKVLMGPPQQITIVADAPEFATAFAVAAIRSTKKEMREFVEARTLVVDTMEAGRELLGHENMAFLLRKEAARSPASFSERGPTVVPLARWHRSANGIPLIVQTSFATKQVLLDMKLSEGRAETLSKGCGGSLSALERMMGSGNYDPPAWASDMELLLPAFLAGAWDNTNPLDQQIIAELADTSTYIAYETQLRRFLNVEDAPLQIESNLYKVTAPIDAFVHAGKLIGENHLERLKPLLVKVFGQLDPEPDPDAPYKPRETDRHSELLRDGLATTVLLIAAWQRQAGLALIAGRGQAFANEVVEALPGLGSDYRVMTSLKDELPLLVEAAPLPFLVALEQMLEGSGAAIRPIFDEIDGLVFPIARHTGLIWALETLAWDPIWFRQACLILAGLADIDPGGRIANRPANSLVDILLAWMPCTYAKLDQRLAVLDEITSDFPQVGWNLIFKLLPGQTTSSSGTSRPRLRGFELPPQPTLTNADVWAAERAAAARAVVLGTYDIDRMGQLLSPMLQFAPPERELALTALKGTLASADKPDRDKLWKALQDQITRHKRFASANWALDADEVAKLEAIADDHSPDDPVLVASELFTFWGDEEDQEAIELRRLDAVRALAADHGPDAVRSLLRRSQQAHLVQNAIDAAGLGGPFLEQLLRGEIKDLPDSWQAGGYFSMLRRAVGEREALKIAADLLSSNTPATVAKLLRAWPTERATWDAASALGDDVLEQYWQDFSSHYIDGDRDTLLAVLTELMRRDRSLVALESVLNRIDEVPTELLFGMLDAIVGELNAGQKPRVGGLLDYELEETFKALDKRDLPDMEIAKREYALLPLLEREKRPLKIHRLLASDPDMFHQVLRDIYRAENTSDPSDAKSDEDRARWRQAYKLLSQFSTVPGFTGSTPERGPLEAWVNAVRALGIVHDRKDVTEIVVGNVLAHAPADDLDEVWPHRFVRDLLEKSPGKVPRGIMTERVNMRGVTVRGMLDGGNQERDLAAGLRKDAETVQRWPKTAAMLRGIADRWDSYAEHEDVDARQRRLRS